MKVKVFIFLVCAVLFSSQLFAYKSSVVVASGSCAILGMTSEQAKLTALQRARADAIEKVSGVKVSANTVVTNGKVSLDLIKSYISGYIVEEVIKGFELLSYKGDDGGAPIPEYKVTISAKVVIPDKKPSYGLKAEMNKKTFIKGEKAFITVKASENVSFAIFNLMANDKVVMLYPNPFKAAEKLKKNEKFIFPKEDATYDLIMSTLPEHEQDVEAFMVSVSNDPEVNFEVLFGYGEEMTLSEFYEIYAKSAEKIEEVILPYQVFKE